MNQNLDKMLEYYVNLDYPDLLKYANISMQNAWCSLKDMFYEEETDAHFALYQFVTHAMIADGDITDLEFTFFNDLTGANFSRERLVSWANAVDDNVLQYFHRLFDQLPEKVQADVLTLCICTCAIDEKINAQEIRYIEKLLD